jgi:hypothetical protein
VALCRFNPAKLLVVLVYLHNDALTLAAIRALTAVLILCAACALIGAAIAAIAATIGAAAIIRFVFVAGRHQLVIRHR